MKDERLEKMKQEYEEIRIPAELRRRVEAGIQKGKEDGEEIIRMNKKSKLIKFVRNTAGAVVAAMLAITIMANSGASIANAMMKIPVLGTIAEIVTFREYKDSTNDMTADVKIPEVSVKNEDGSVNQETTDAVNKSIQEYTDEIIAQYKADVEASGGEGKQLVDLEYEVITDSDRLFSIRFDKLQIMASGAESVKIYHIDKQTGQMINLKGLFKEDVNFIDPISDNIKKQMKEQMAADESKMYFIDSDMPESDFQSITEDTTFYVNDSGKLVIVFDEYEVAPGSMGVVEFEIPTDVIQDIVQDGFVS
ncbi:DUF3298 and DUF4163 domain-containing protein [Lachnoclostridium sp. An138]|uniref:DUF3298 and DUF4163 domain-containing protein n=1 Tax=Lachnoclostridium sp. An138 TaxID=1965560 RepID=UPI000B39ED0E|nr:DUF3298 and DUF4163 domain-containing protein [Lachnoclostridium sp. An138]OUQ19993.1 hypothetical protein B5E82_04005 [Lachnoclostridium sp. An138]